MLLHFVSNLQRKPERVRRQIAFFVSVSLTACIVLLWLVSMSARVQEPADSSALRRAEEEEKSPLRALSDAVGAFLNDAGAAARELRESFSSFEETRRRHGTEAEP